MAKDHHSWGPPDEKGISRCCCGCGGWRQSSSGGNK